MNLLTISELATKLNVTRTTIYRWEVFDPDFPRRIKLSPRVVRFDADAITAWINTKKESTHETIGDAEQQAS